jgi:hypothetical protein
MEAQLQVGMAVLIIDRGGHAEHQHSQIHADTDKDLCVSGSNTTVRSHAMLPQPSYSSWGNTGRVSMQMMYLVEGEAELVLDDLGAREDGNVLQIARLALTKAGCLHCNNLRTNSHDHNDMGS